MHIDRLVPLLNVEDPERSIAFYTATLGFQVAETAEADGRTVRALLRNGSVTLMINRPGHADSAARRRRPSYGDVVLYITVPSARESQTALRAAGVAAGEVALEAHGMEAFSLRDPDGYEIAIGSPVMRIA